VAIITCHDTGGEGLNKVIVQTRLLSFSDVLIICLSRVITERDNEGNIVSRKLNEAPVEYSLDENFTSYGVDRSLSLLSVVVWIGDAKNIDQGHYYTFRKAWRKGELIWEKVDDPAICETVNSDEVLKHRSRAVLLLYGKNESLTAYISRRGLANSENNCYQNSVFRFLGSIAGEWASTVTDRKKRKSFNVRCSKNSPEEQLAVLITRMNDPTNDRHPIDPLPLMNNWRELSNSTNFQFPVKRHCDATEFLQFVFEVCRAIQFQDMFKVEIEKTRMCGYCYTTPASHISDTREDTQLQLYPCAEFPTLGELMNVKEEIAGYRCPMAVSSYGVNCPSSADDGWYAPFRNILDQQALKTIDEETNGVRIHQSGGACGKMMESITLREIGLLMHEEAYNRILVNALIEWLSKRDKVLVEKGIKEKPSIFLTPEICATLQAKTSAKRKAEIEFLRFFEEQEYTDMEKYEHIFFPIKEYWSGHWLAFVAETRTGTLFVYDSVPGTVREKVYRSA
jgi:hypothetical protein